MAQLDEESNKVKYSKAMRHHASYVWKWQYGEEQEETGEVLVEQEKARHCRRFPMELIANFSVMTFTDKRGSPSPRDVVRSLTERYGLVEPQAPWVAVEPAPAPVVVAPAAPPTNGSTVKYASFLADQLTEVQLTQDDEL
jgi:hypothetical protein